MLRGVCEAGTIKTDGTVNTKDFKKQKAEERKEKFLERKVHGQLSREIAEKVDKEKSWYWLSRGDVKVETGALLCAAQEPTIRTNYIKHHIDKSIDSPMCRMCGKLGESVQHIVSGCEKLAQKEYKRRHDNVAKKIHWDLCKRHDLEHHLKWYDHIPEGAIENDKIKLLWDINIV